MWRYSSPLNMSWIWRVSCVKPIPLLAAKCDSPERYVPEFPNFLMRGIPGRFRAVPRRGLSKLYGFQGLQQTLSTERCFRGIARPKFRLHEQTPKYQSIRTVWKIQNETVKALPLKFSRSPNFRRTEVASPLLLSLRVPAGILLEPLGLFRRLHQTQR